VVYMMPSFPSMSQGSYCHQPEHRFYSPFFLPISKFVFAPLTIMFLAYRAIKKHRARKAAGPAASQGQAGTTATDTSTASRITTLTKSSSNNASKQAKACPSRITEKSRARKYRWKLVLCLMPAFLVASLDLTIIATALPQIASHFDKFNQLNWIVTAFTLTSTAFIPVFGQISDTFGRYATLQFSVVLLTIGSVLCAAAPDWGVLLLGRALQGIGTAGVSNVSLIVLADNVTLKEQAVNTSTFQLVNGIGYGESPFPSGTAFTVGRGFR